MTTRSRRPKGHAGGKTHPDASILLAYLRGQQLEPQWRVREHVEQEHCPLCVQKLSELEQVTTLLQGLGALHAERDDPASSVAQTYARIESLAQQRHAERPGVPAGASRQRPRTSAVRLISIPVAFGLAILLTMTVLVFADWSAKSTSPFSSGGTRPGQSMLTVTVPSHSFSTAKTSEVKEPQIKICSKESDLAQLRLVICGFHFDSSHNANLAISVPGKKLLWVRGIHVGKNGTLRVEWTIHDCRSVPNIIYGYEVTGSKPIEVALQITSFGSCQDFAQNSRS